MFRRSRLYWPLIKAPQTGLLLATGPAGYLSAGTTIHQLTLLGLAGTLLLSISGSTILNLGYDHDTDAKMKRTHRRALASSALSGAGVVRVGGVAVHSGCG